MSAELIDIATTNITDILNHSIDFDPKINRALVVFDTQNQLTKILTEAYRLTLPEAKFIDFDATDKQEIIREFHSLSPQDLVVMIQTTSFRLDEFRIRIHLFNQKLKVIEHLHLYRNLEPTWPIYIDSLAYDPTWYRQIGPILQSKLANCQTLTIKTSDQAGQMAEIKVLDGLEIPKLNIGDYSGMENIGGTFPIGEVFTEAKTLESLSGEFWVYAFADINFEIMTPPPFKVKVENGMVTTWSQNAPIEFGVIMAAIRAQERSIVREIGFGLNRAMSKTQPLGDITAFERIVGVHLSLGEKHSVYKKPGIVMHKARFHVDLFLQTEEVLVDGEVIFRSGEYLC